MEYQLELNLDEYTPIKKLDTPLFMPNFYNENEPQEMREKIKSNSEKNLENQKENSKENFNDEVLLLVEIFKYEKNLDLKEKLFLTIEIIKNKSLLIMNEYFYEEECLFSLINWAVNSSYEINYSYINKKNNLDQNLLLLNNILYILESFPINQSDLLSFNLIQKFNKIKKNIKNINYNIFCRIEKLIFKWNTFLQNKQFLLSNKTLRDNFNEEQEEILRNNDKTSYAKEFNDLKNEKNKETFQESSYPKIKSILKIKENSSNTYKNNQKKLQWKNDDELNNVKIFKFYESPSSPEISHEEYFDIQKELFLKKLNEENLQINNYFKI